VRALPNLAARSYRDPDGHPWLEGMPPLITMLPESPRSPTRLPGRSKTRFSASSLRTSPAWRSLRQYGITRQQRVRLAVAWEVPVPEVGRSVFVHWPPDLARTGDLRINSLSITASSSRSQRPIVVAEWSRIGPRDCWGGRTVARLGLNIQSIAMRLSSRKAER